MASSWTKIPMIGQPHENVDESELDQVQATVQDAYVNELDHIVKRPGLDSWLDLGTAQGIDGLYWWDKKKSVLAVSAGRVWKITDSSGTKSELTGSTDLVKSGNVTFAGDNDAANVVMANGEKMVHTDNATLVTMTDADAPVLVSHVTSLDGYIIANALNSHKIHFSSSTDHTAWSALDFVSAEGNPDDILSIKEGYRELIIVGRESVEFWINDGATPFSRLEGSFQPFGGSAAHSLARIGSSWIWLDHERRLVTMQGRNVVPVSNPYERVIQRFTSVDDAKGYVISVDGYPLYILNFPTARTTLVYNYSSQKWSKWGFWDTAKGSYDRFKGQSYCYARAWNFHLIGDNATGKIYKMAKTTFQDDGNAIRTLSRTGNISHGTETQKISHEVRIRTKRGVANADIADPQFVMRARRNNRGPFGNERWRSLGQAGEHELHLRYQRNGRYKTIQYEFIHSDPSNYVLIGGDERITALGK